MNKIIFLDVDGVLNIYSESYYTAWLTKDDGAKHIEEHLILRLDWILKNTDANIIISSSWRLDMDELQKQMESAGFKKWDRVVGRTSISKFRWRGEEIEDWLEHHPDTGDYIVLEDEIDDVAGEKCNKIPMKNIVEIDMQTGITHKDAERVVLALGRNKQ